jgi:hypothetical protein
LAELQDIGWLKPEHATRVPGTPLRKVGSYVITPFAESVYELANATCAEVKREIELERQMRADQRALRSAVLSNRTQTAQRSCY